MSPLTPLVIQLLLALFFLVPLSQACTTGCQAGFVSNGTACQLCPSGTYQHNSSGSVTYAATSQAAAPCSGASSCVRCPAGSYQPTTGQTTCFACPSGYNQTTAGSSSCGACPLGTYATSEGSSSCSPCSALSTATPYTLAVASVSATGCVNQSTLTNHIYRDYPSLPRAVLPVFPPLPSAESDITAAFAAYCAFYNKTYVGTDYIAHLQAYNATVLALQQSTAPASVVHLWERSDWTAADWAGVLN